MLVLLLLLLCFNSRLVRLKVSTFCVGDSTGSCFNSRLVRLKAIEVLPVEESIEKFQFQIGSIKSAAIGVHENTLFLVSIPDWFD